jgi:transposase
VENAIRPTTLGKKNWLFGQGGVGQRGAILYKIIEKLPPPRYRSLHLPA